VTPELPKLVESLLLYVFAPCAGGLLLGLFVRLILRTIRQSLGVAIPSVALLTAIGVLSVDKALVLSWSSSALSVGTVGTLMLKEWIESYPAGGAAAGIGLTLGILLREWWHSRSMQPT